MGVMQPEQVDLSEENTSFPTEMDLKSSSSNPEKEPEESSMDINGIKGEEKEADKLVVSDTPKDAVDEWPAAKKIHTFFFVRVRMYEDPVLKSKMENAARDLEQKNQARSQLIDELRAKRSQRSNLKAELQPFLNENRRYREEMDRKMGEIKPLRDALGEFRTATNSARDRGIGLCSSEEELDDLIYSLNYRIQHESNTLVEEKKLLKEIKQLESTREKVIANASMKAKIDDSKIQDKVKLLGADMDGVRKEKQVVIAQIKQIDEEVKAIENDIKLLEEQLQAVTEKREKIYETLSSLKRAHTDMNISSYQNQSLLNTAGILAKEKDIAKLEALCNSEMDKFMSQWSSNKDFRDDYERHVLSSLDRRQLTRDGRMRNPDEKPIIAETTKASISATKHSVSESVEPSSKQEVIPLKKTQKEEPVKSTKANGMEKKTEEEEEFLLSTKPQEALQKPKEIDAAKLKEMKREEEIAKAKAAMERKKKQAEKAAAKAAARAQREAEKKLKEKEKKAKRKAGTGESTPSEPDIDAQAATEPEESDGKSEEKPVKEAKVKERKVNDRRKNRPKANDQIPRVVLKRKKSFLSSFSKVDWAVAAAGVAILIAMGLGYYFGKI